MIDNRDKNIRFVLCLPCRVVAFMLAKKKKKKNTSDPPSYKTSGKLTFTYVQKFMITHYESSSAFRTVLEN